MLRTHKSIVGLDLGSQVVKAVEITLEGTEPVITGFSRVEVGPSGDRRAAIGEVFQLGRFRSRNVVTSVSGQSVVIRYISMIQMSDSELRDAIRFESDRYLPFDANEIVLDCQRLTRPSRNPNDTSSEGGDQMTVVLAACRKAVINEKLAEIAAHGLTPVAVDVDAFALANAWEICGQPGVFEGDEEGMEQALALVDMGASRTQTNVLSGGETCFSREIGIGGSDMTQAVARRLGVDPSEAEAIKRGNGGHNTEVSHAIAPVLEDLVSEITLSLDYVENREGVHVEEVLLSGGGVLASGVVSFIGQGIGCAARIWNPIGGLRVASDRVDVEALEEGAASLAVAVGLASRIRAA